MSRTDLELQQRRDDVPCQRRERELGDQEPETEALPQARRRMRQGARHDAQSSVTTRWLEVANTHDTPRPPVTLRSRRTSGLDANAAPCRSS